MRLQSKKLGMAFAAVTLATWILCSLAVALLPEATMGITAHMFHLEPQAHTWSLGWGSFAMGAICWTGFALLAGWGVGVAYNMLVSDQGVRA